MYRNSPSWLKLANPVDPYLLSSADVQLEVVIKSQKKKKKSFKLQEMSPGRECG